MLEYVRGNPQTFDGGDPCMEFASASIEERDFVPRAQAHHMQSMVRSIFGKHAGSAGAQRPFHVKARPPAGVFSQPGVLGAKRSDRPRQIIFARSTAQTRNTASNPRKTIGWATESQRPIGTI